MKLKAAVYFIVCVIFLLCNNPSFAQNKKDSLLNKNQDTNLSLLNRKQEIVTRKIKDTVNKQKVQIPVLHDTNTSQNMVDSGIRITFTDTLKNSPDTLSNLAQTLSNKHYAGDSLLLSKNKYINFKGKSAYLIEEPHTVLGKEFLFYILCATLLILGLFKTFFKGYFNNLFRVFFNTSLKQTQLSDQLKQSTLPSFILNIFFTVTAGIYIWLLFSFYHPPRLFNGKMLLPFCILSIAIIYFFKFCMLKFMGWVSDIQESTDNYIFSIFLVNKITGIFLLPVIILLAFINRQWLPAITNISFMIIGLLFLSRYVKSYGAIEKKIPVNPFHFIIYIAGAEIIPLLILYKVTIDYLI
jgi:hypothetical protein